MGCPTEVEIGDNLVFSVNTHAVSTGAATDADAVPSYRIYEDETGTAILSGNMALLDDANTTGFYSETIAATSGNGFENGKTYTVYVSAAVASVTGTISYGVKAYDQRKAGVTLVDYLGPKGPGVYIDSGAANTNTVTGTDGIISNPVSTFAAARTIADAIGTSVYYIVGNSDLTLAATHNDWSFIGMGEVSANVVNLGSQDVGRSAFYNLTVEGTQGGSARIYCEDCALQDPGAGDTTLHIFAQRCGLVDRLQVDTSNDNVFDSCYSLVAGTSTPVIDATGAAGTISIRHYSGGIEFESLSASHNVSVETDGQVIFASDCNVNATVAIRGNCTITDNTAGMSNISDDARVLSLDAAMPATPTVNSPYDVLNDLSAVLPGSGTLSTLTAADVNAEVLDVIFTDLQAEISSIPAASASLGAKIDLLYVLARNKVTQTATTATLRNDADSASIGTASVSDDATTYTRAEWG